MLKYAAFAALFALAVATPTPRVLSALTSETVLPLPELFSRYYNVYNLQAPAGTYKGSKSVLGQNVVATMVLESNSALQFVIAGPVSINCDKEAYTFTNNAFAFPNAGKSDDCLYKALKANSVTLQEVSYDPTADTVTVKVKYSVITITLLLAHQTEAEVASPIQETVIPMPELFSRYYKVFQLQNPSGTYLGSKSVLGETVKATAVVNSTASTFDFLITGPVTIDCQAEQYTYANNAISLPNISKSGDCLHDEMAENKVTLVSFDYDSSSDSFTFAVKYTILTITITLTHQA